MLIINTYLSGFPILLSTFYGELIESEDSENCLLLKESYFKEN